MRIRINEVEYHVEISGEGHPLLLLHGFTGSCRSWDHLLPIWEPHVQTISVDLVGHGQTDAPDDIKHYSMERSVQDLTDLLDHLQLPKASVLGYSMGGRLAISMAMQKPERVSALILVSTSPGLASKEERAARADQDEQLAVKIEANGIPWFVDYWENISLFATVKKLPQQLQQRIRQQRLNNRSQGLAHSLRGMGTGVQPSWWDKLPDLPMPVLITAGELDHKFMQIAKRMADKIPYQAFKSIPEAGHMLYVEQAELFGTMVVAFLHENIMDPI